MGFMAVCAFASNAFGGERGEPTWYHVNVHISTKIGVPAAESLLWASQATATEIFARVGVQLTWRSGRQRRATCAVESATRDLAIEIVRHAPENVGHDALAAASPYGDSDVRIVVFYERVAPLLQGNHDHEASIFGHVLAHEICHVLQGLSRHSEAGVMRARWTRDDYTQMGRGTLSLTGDDVRFIQLGVAHFEAQAGCPQASNLRP